jgi:hypothetical protein
VEPFTLRAPAVVEQVTSTVLDVVVFASTVRLLGFCPLTEQFDLMLESSTWWLPSLRPEKVTEPFGPISLDVEPSTVTV